ncbi:MAG: TIM barrel protein [Anaerolineae bacterium]|nr:TIM barrel protein [Anaerolineae bacterium]
MRLGLGSYACAWAIGVPGFPAPAQPMQALDLIERAAQLGLALVQICDNLPLHTLSPKDLDALAHRADALGVRIVLGTRGLVREHLLTYLQLCGRFGGAILRVVIDTSGYQPSLDEIVALLKALTPDLRAAGVCLAIENHDRFRARDLAAILERVASEHVGICLDTVNSFGALEGPELVVGVLAPWVVDLHIKDFALFRAPHNMGFTIEGRPAGQGRLDVPWVLDVLRAHHRSFDAILELWPPPEATLAETIAKEARWAELSVAYLRRYIHG